MELTQSNYYSPEANEAYWSASLVKEFLDCPARAIAELKGEYERPESTALLVGSFVDRYFESPKSFSEWCEEHHDDIFTKRGTMRAEFEKGQDMIRRIMEDPVFMEYLEGEHQHIQTGTIAGFPFKAKFDAYVPGVRIVDLKTVRDMAPVYKPGQGRVDFATAWNWPLQMAIYQKLEGNKLPCYLAVVTKEDPPDIALIEIPQDQLDAELSFVESMLPMMDAMRVGALEPARCGKCPYCRQTHKLSGPIRLDIFNGEVDTDE